MEKGKPSEVSELEDWYGVNAKRTRFGWIIKSTYGTFAIYSDSTEEIEKELISKLSRKKSLIRKQAPFSEFWEKLAERLAKPTIIRNWTVFSGYIGENFEAMLYNAEIIRCTLQNGKQLYVPKEDFRIVYEKWGDYLARNVKRFELTKKSKFTKYTISIIHQFEELMYS